MGERERERETRKGVSSVPRSRADFYNSRRDGSFTLISGWIYRWSANDWVSATKPNLDRGGPFVVFGSLRGSKRDHLASMDLVACPVTFVLVSYSLLASLFLSVSLSLVTIKGKTPVFCEYCSPTQHRKLLYKQQSLEPVSFETKIRGEATRMTTKLRSSWWI